MDVSDLPAGWSAVSGYLEPAESVAAYAARLQPVKGICRAKGCFRRVTLEPKELCGQGLGRLQMRRVEKLWECSRLEGCSLQFHKEPAGNPLRLSALVGKPNMRLRVRCRANGCKYFRVVRVEEMVAGLVKRGQGDERMEVDKLPDMMTSGCPLCKKTNWAVEVLYIDRSTMGWKRLGERSFDDVGRTGGV